MPDAAPHARISILIVNYKAYGEVAACLAALDPASARSPLEVVVVDHAGSLEAADALRARFPAARVIATRENPGFGAGVNRAARAATGEYLLVLNPDTIPSPALAEGLADWLEQHREVAIVGPLVRDAGGQIEASARRRPGWSTLIGGRSTWLTRLWPENPVTRRNLLVGPHVTSPIDVDWVSGACFMVRRDVFDRLGGFDERYFMYWEDADLCRRARALGWRVAYHPGFTVQHLGARSSRQRSRASAVAFHASVFRYYWTHGSMAARLLAPLVGLALAGRLAVSLAARRR